MSPKIGDKVKVVTKTDGNKVFLIDLITEKNIHLKKNKFGLTVNSERVNFTNKKWYGANFEYISFN